MCTLAKKGQIQIMRCIVVIAQGSATPSATLPLSPRPIGFLGFLPPRFLHEDVDNRYALNQYDDDRNPW